MTTRRLHNTEMKKLVSLLHTPHPDSDKAYKKEIKDLPGHLRSPLTSLINPSSTLCSLHKGLNPCLISDIWSWVSYELKSGIGKFLYPIIMSGRLPSAQEWKMRSLEPVLEMWREDFSVEASAPPGHTPLVSGTKWKYEASGCTACMLSRIGAEQQILVALYAGMLGRFSLKKLFRMEVPAISVELFDEVRSKRVRFVRYWIKSSPGGEAALHEAVVLGIMLKGLHEELNQTGNTLKGPQQDPFGDHAEIPSQSVNAKIHDWIKTNAHESASKLGPNPRPQDIDPHSPLSRLGMPLPHPAHRPCPHPTNPFATHASNRGSSHSSISRTSSIHIAPLHIDKHTQTPPQALPSRFSDSTAASSDSSTRITGRPSSKYDFDPLATPDEMVQKYRALLATGLYYGAEQAHARLPEPGRKSMYSAYGHGLLRDPFEGADEDGVGEDGGRPATVWDDLY